MLQVNKKTLHNYNAKYTKSKKQNFLLKKVTSTRNLLKFLYICYYYALITIRNTLSKHSQNSKISPTFSQFEIL